MTSSTTHSVPHLIHTVQRSDGRCDYRLMMMYRTGRGLIQAPEVDYVGSSVSPASQGVILSYTCEDGARESIGSETHPLPLEVLEASQSDAGLAVIYMQGSPENARLVGGQVLYTELETESDAARLSPTCAA